MAALRGVSASTSINVPSTKIYFKYETVRRSVAPIPIEMAPDRNTPCTRHTIYTPVPVRARSTSFFPRTFVTSRSDDAEATTTLHGYVHRITRSRLTLGTISLDVKTILIDPAWWPKAYLIFLQIYRIPSKDERGNSSMFVHFVQGRGFFFLNSDTVSCVHSAPVSPLSHSRFTQNDRWHGQVDINTRYTHT